MDKEEIKIEIQRMEQEIRDSILKFGPTKVGKWVNQKPQVISNYKNGFEKWSYNKIIKIYSLLMEKLKSDIKKNDY